MKKLLCVLVLCMMLAAPMVYACGDAPPVPADVSLLFLPNNAKADLDCGIFCPGSKTGLVDWVGDKITTIDLDTGDGFCRPTTPDGRLKWLLCNCDAADEIKVNGRYGFTIEILTPGVEFENLASIHNPTITFDEYNDKSDLCADIDPAEKTLGYKLTDDEIGANTVLVTKAYKNLFSRNKLYISFCDLPRLIIDQRIVPYGTPITLRLGIYDAALVCAPECSRLCQCTRIVAILGCFDECCAVMPYLPLADGWWSGISISNLSGHGGSVAVVFVKGEEKVIKHFTVGPYEILPLNVGDYMATENCMAIIKSSFNMKAVCFGGSGAMAFGLPAETCGSCQ